LLQLATQFAHYARMNAYAVAVRRIRARVLADYRSPTTANKVVEAAEKAGKPIAYVVDVIIDAS